MNADRTEILVLLDESGSMEAIREDMIGGFNAFLRDQQNAPGDARLSLIKFSNMDWGGTYYRPVFLSEPIGAVQTLGKAGFIPRGNTPLLDALARAIDELGARLANTPEGQRPAKVIFVIITDGAENSSRYQSRQSVMERIRHQQGRYGWQFVYLGANQDAIAVAHDLGISAGQTMTWATANVGATYAATSEFVTRSREADVVAYASNSFTDAERLAAGVGPMSGTIVVDTKTTGKP